MDLANSLLNGATAATATVPTPLTDARALALKRSVMDSFGFEVSIFGDSDQNASHTALAPSAKLLFVLPASASAKLVRVVKLISYWSILLFLFVVYSRDSSM